MENVNCYALTPLYDLVEALAPKEPHSDAAGPPTDEERILQYVREHGAITNAEARSLLGQDARRVRYLLSLLQKKGLVRQEGEKRWVRYVLP